MTTGDKAELLPCQQCKGIGYGVVPVCCGQTVGGACQGECALQGQQQCDACDGTGREAAPSPPASGENGCKCQGCGAFYRVDIQVPNDIWERIKPTGKSEGGGLLCGRCIVAKVEALGEFAALQAAAPDR